MRRALAILPIFIFSLGALVSGPATSGAFGSAAFVPGVGPLSLTAPATRACAGHQDPQDPQKKPEPEDEVISMETNLVVANVTVTDAGGNHVSGLKAQDFTLLENNARQKILSFNSEETPFAAAILLDVSGSIESKLSLARAACGNFVERIRDGDVFALYSFSGYKVKTLQDFTEVRDLPDSIWDLRADGETPLYDGIVKAAEALSKRPERRRAIILISDGADTKSKASLDEATRKAVGAHVALYAVDLSDKAVFGTMARDNGAEIMKTLATKTGGRFFGAPGGAQLRDALTSAVEELRTQYTLTYESSNEKLDGRWRAIEVRIAKPGLTIRTRQGYYAQKKKG
jgi:Ca-activated chloride channel family protein